MKHLVIREVEENFQEIEASKKINNKRTFLKLAGVVGLGAAASLLIPKKAEALVFGSTPASNVVGIKDHLGNKIDPAKEDGNLAIIAGVDFATSAKQDTINTALTSVAQESGGNLAATATNTNTVATNTAGFLINNTGAYIRQDTNYTIARESNGNLDLIKTDLDKFNFDESKNLKVTSGAVNGNVGLLDKTNTQINPVQDDTVVLLRRLVKIMESQATVDFYSRQRVAISEVYGTGASVALQTPRVTVANDSVVILGTGTNSIGYLAAGTNGIGSLTAGTAEIGKLAAGTQSIGSVWLAGQNQQMFQDPARMAYATGIRQNLSF